MPYDRNHPNRKRHVSYIQLKRLYELLHEHRDIAVGENKSDAARKKKNKLWQKAAPVLNNIDRGNAIKTPSGWAKYWNDLKGKINQKIRLYREANEKGSPKELEFSDIQVKLLSILDPDYSSKYPNMRVLSLDPSIVSSEDDNKSDTESLSHSKKRRYSSQSSDLDDNDSKWPEDEYSAFGIHIANQLRNLSSVELYINAVDEIHTIVTRYRLEDLKQRSLSHLNDDNSTECKDVSQILPKCYDDDEE